jgi:hypothetical protein
VHRELTRRRTILGERVLETIKAIERPGRAADLAELLDYSELLERVRLLMPAASESLVRTAKERVSVIKSELGRRGAL